MAETVIKSIQGSEMHLLSDDSGISAHLAEYGIREPTATMVYQERLRNIICHDNDPVTVLDIGANIGYYALMPCAIHGDSARVLAIEPDPANIDILRKNIDLNGYQDSITVLQGAVGASESEATLRRMAESNLSTLHPDHESGTPTDSVSVEERPVADYCEQAGIDPAAVDVLRMDVEGYETDILRGATPLLSAVDTLLCHIEFHPPLFDADETGFLIDLFETNPVDVHCVATQQPEERSHTWPGIEGLLSRRWSPQVIFTWDLREYGG